MKYYVYLCFALPILVTLAGCQSKKEDVDPRDQYVGFYAVEYRAFMVGDYQLNQFYYRDVMKMTKSTKTESGLTLTFSQFTIEASLLSDGKLKIEPLKKHIPVYINGKYTQEEIYTGEGTITANTITIELKASYTIVNEIEKTYESIKLTCMKQ